MYLSVDIVDFERKRMQPMLDHHFREEDVLKKNEVLKRKKLVKGKGSIIDRSKKYTQLTDLQIWMVNCYHTS